MCDVEKAIKCNQSDDDHDHELDEEQQQQQQQHALAEQEQQQRQQQRQLSVVTDVRSSGSSRCFGQLLKLLLSSPGLVLLVTGYSVLGALIFPLLEAPQDLSKSAAIAKSREDCLRELWIITGESAGEKSISVFFTLLHCPSIMHTPFPHLIYAYSALSSYLFTLHMICRTNSL